MPMLRSFSCPKVFEGTRTLSWLLFARLLFGRLLVLNSLLYQSPPLFDWFGPEFNSLYQGSSSSMVLTYYLFPVLFDNKPWREPVHPVQMEDASMSSISRVHSVVCYQTKLEFCQKLAAGAHRAELVTYQLRLSNGNHDHIHRSYHTLELEDSTRQH